MMKLPSIYSTSDLTRDFAEGFASDDESDTASQVVSEEELSEMEEDQSSDDDGNSKEEDKVQVDVKPVEQDQAAGHSSESSEDCNEDIEPSVLEAKLKQLQNIEDRLDRFEYKISLSKEQYEKLLVNLMVYIWTRKAGVQLKNSFDQLGASKHRTKFGVIVESLMKLLCELDQVESLGNSQIKSKRRSLVRKINNEVLPKADSAFSRATQFVEFSLRLLKNSAVEKPKTEEASKETQTSETKPEAESMESNIEATESVEEEVNKEVATKKEKVNKKLACKRESSEKLGKPAVDFETSETHSAYVLRLTIPEKETVRDVSFTLDSDSEMTIKGKTFSLPVEVNPRNAVLSESTYEFINRRTILVKIPKRKRRVVRPRYQQPTYENFSHRAQHRRPMVWGW